MSKTMATNITMQKARDAYREGNNAGDGFSPSGEELIDDAVSAYVAGGAWVIHERNTSDDVAVIEFPNGRVIAIGGDARGRNAWAVDITRAVRP